jgi:hypothetical protein
MPKKFSQHPIQQRIKNFFEVALGFLEEETEKYE